MPVAAAAKAPAASSTATAITAAAQGKTKRRLRVVLLAVLLLVLAGTVAGLWWLKHQGVEDEGEDAPAALRAAPVAGATQAGAAATPAAATPRIDPKSPPLFMALEPFTVNLADREAERYAQLGITLEISDSKVADQLKAYMPALRNNILMAIADKTAVQLMDREGKLKLASEIQRETARVLGYTPEAAAAAATESAQDADGGPRKKSKKLVEPPVRAVHFSNFIIQ
jgi:flagellar protein FliL